MTRKNKFLIKFLAILVVLVSVLLETDAITISFLEPLQVLDVNSWFWNAAGRGKVNMIKKPAAHAAALSKLASFHHFCLHCKPLGGRHRIVGKDHY
jgi:hypothetical protein